MGRTYRRGSIPKHLICYHDMQDQVCRTLPAVITGAHFLLYSRNADADRAFLRDILGFQSVDAGGGWLIFGLPPAEIAVHPGSGEFEQTHAGHTIAGTALYLMC